MAPEKNPYSPLYATWVPTKKKSHGSDSYGLFGLWRRCTECQWFVKFRNNNFDLEGEQQSRKPRQSTSDDLQALLDKNPRQSTRELAEMLHVNQSTVKSVNSPSPSRNGKNPESRQMASSQIVRKEHGRPQKHLCHVARETTTGKFFAQYYDGRWKMDHVRQSR